MKKTNSFGAAVSEGNNLAILKKARTWFKENKDIDIVQYFHSFSNTSRDRHWLKASDYHSCAICGRDLYKKSEGKARQMKHFIFIDSMANQHYVCAYLNRCLTRVKAEDQVDKVLPVSFPSFSQFHEIEDSSDFPYREDMEKAYEKYALPFLEKWYKIEIMKSNVFEFYRDLSEIESRYLIWYEPDAANLFVRKIMKLIGVMYD